MTSKQIFSALLPIALLAALSCSKTKDTAPERRIFGSPPTIESVDLANFSNPESHVDCDFSPSVLSIICSIGVVDVVPQTGTGWTLAKDPNDPNHSIVVHSDVPSTEPGARIQGTYTELTFTAKVTDPESTPQQSNILLVGASYVPDPKNSNTETTLVLFDDGSQIDFPFDQKALVPEDCTFDLAEGICTCTAATYKIESGDLQKGDSTYTRKFAIANSNASEFLKDCIKRTHKEIPVTGNAGDVLQFKIEAVDRQGNLATFPTKLTATVGAGTFACNGDSCGCCILYAFSGYGIDPSQCHGEDGMISPSRAPNGVCHDIL